MALSSLQPLSLALSPNEMNEYGQSKHLQDEITKTNDETHDTKYHD